jgi:Plasmid replication region DNA-binding N-term
MSESSKEASPPRAAGPSGLRVRVFAAADTILRSGRRPTIEAIRQQLGGGSQTTLMAHLNDWYSELGERLAAAESPLAGLPAEASQLLQQLWRVASTAVRLNLHDANAEADIAQRLFGAERESLAAQNKALDTLNGELKAQRRNVERLLTDTRALLARREAELGEERSQRGEAEQSLARAMLDVEVLRAQQSARLTRRPLSRTTKARRATSSAKLQRSRKVPPATTHTRRLLVRQRKSVLGRPKQLPESKRQARSSKAKRGRHHAMRVPSNSRKSKRPLYRSNRRSL